MGNFNYVIEEIKDEKEKEICAKIMSETEPWITLGITYDKIKATLDDFLYKVFAVKYKDEIIATFVIQTKGAFTGYLKSIAVKNEWRGKKIGETMMSYLENEIFKESKNVFLCVSSFNKRAQKFYENLGYKKIGILEDYVIKGYDEIIMRKTIGPLL